MSRIAEMVKEMIESKETNVVEDKRKYVVSLRVDGFTKWAIDKLHEVAGGTKTALCQEILSEGVLEGFEALGTKLDDLRCMYIAERSGKSLEEVKAEYDQTGIFIDGKRAEMREDGFLYVDGVKVQGEENV